MDWNSALQEDSIHFQENLCDVTHASFGMNIWSIQISFINLNTFGKLTICTPKEVYWKTSSWCRHWWSAPWDLSQWCWHSWHGFLLDLCLGNQSRTFAWCSCPEPWPRCTTISEPFGDVSTDARCIVFLGFARWLCRHLVSSRLGVSCCWAYPWICIVSWTKACLAVVVSLHSHLHGMVVALLVRQSPCLLLQTCLLVRRTVTGKFMKISWDQMTGVQTLFVHVFNSQKQLEKDLKTCAWKRDCASVTSPNFIRFEAQIKLLWRSIDRVQ